MRGIIADLYNPRVQAGLVIEYHREYCWVELADGREVIAKPRSRLELTARAEEQDWRKEGRILFAQQLTVGDSVQVAEPEPEHFTIEEVGERETYLIRRSIGRYRRKPQCIVANADQLAVVVAPGALLKLPFVDRAFIAALQGGLTPLLVVNKIDLEPGLAEDVLIRNYRELGYSVHFSSAISGQGLAELSAELNGKITVFAGQSGVGKSTILSQLTGQEIRTGVVAEKTGKGRQTTTTARLYHLPDSPDSRVVDTPGVKEFGFWHLTWLDVHEYFSRIAELSQQCGFRDCLHRSEPDCAVRKAVSEGRLSGQRVEAYIRLRQEADESTRYWEG